eukprot:12334689-Prorocentrum_lima.AAC.1
MEESFKKRHSLDEERGTKAHRNKRRLQPRHRTRSRASRPRTSTRRLLAIHKEAEDIPVEATT